jgi:hypothetical protein
VDNCVNIEVYTIDIRHVTPSPPKNIENCVKNRKSFAKLAITKTH